MKAFQSLYLRSGANGLSLSPPSQISRFRDGLGALFRLPSPISSFITFQTHPSMDVYGRLELQAAVISTRLHLMIMDELDFPINSATFWTDSMTVLQYVNNEKRRFKPLIANRVTEIHDASSPEQWRHVPTSLNPADEGSRGTDIHALKTKCRWLFGPKFLFQPEDQWPVREIGKIPDDDKEVEVEKHVTFITRGSGLDQLLRRYSSWLKL